MKRILAMTLVLIMALSLFGCGKAVKFEDKAKELGDAICEKKYDGFGKASYSVEDHAITFRMKVSFYNLSKIDQMMDIGWTEDVQKYKDGIEDVLTQLVAAKETLVKAGFDDASITLTVVDNDDVVVYESVNGEVSVDELTPILERTDTTAALQAEWEEKFDKLLGNK